MKIKAHLVLALILAVAVGVSIVIFLRSPDEGSKELGAPVKDLPADTASGGKEVVHLYFSDTANHFLMAEQRPLVKPSSAADFGRNIVLALIEGPGDGLMRTLPEETQLRAFFLDTFGMAYVDLSQAAREKHPGGAESEMMTIYSIVNSLVLNVDEIKMVKILIEGREITTLAGHIHTRDPFSANMLLIR